MHYEQLNPDECMSYLISNPEKESCIIVDPKLDYVDFYLNILKERGENLLMVIDTHTHADHISGSSALIEKTGCQYGMHENTEVSCITRRFKDGDKIEVGGIPIEIIHTPGHTEDSICIVFEDKIFTGDFVFLDYGGGRSDLPTGDMDQQWSSLKRIKKLPEHLIICPGHNYHQSSPSTLWLQKKKNPYFRLKDRKAFRRYLHENKPEDPPTWVEDVVQGNKDCIKDGEEIDIPDMDGVCQGSMKRVMSSFLMINAEQLRERMKENKTPILLDVRSSKEMKVHPQIKGSINIPLGGLYAGMGEIEKYKGYDVVIVCRTGYKSRVAAKILLKSGFRKVFVLQGGIQAYYSA